MSSSRTFSHAAESFLQHGGSGRFLPIVVDRFGPELVDTITPLAVRQAAEEAYPFAKPATRNRQFLTPARAVLYHAHELGWRMSPRIRPFRLIRERGAPPANRRWMERFIEQCDRDGLPHLAACVLFMNLTAARVSEAVALLGRHVDLKDRTAILVKTKTGVMSVRHMPEHLVERIRDLAPGPDDRVFRYTSRFSVNERIAAVCQRAGLPYKSTHRAGRHAFATNALNGGVNIRDAMDAGEWKTVTIFIETYVHSTNAGRNVRDLFEAQHRRDQF